MSMEKNTEIFEIKESLRFDVEELIFNISYSTSKASVNWSLNLNPSQLVFADPIKLSNGARILSIDLFQKNLAGFSAFKSLPKTHVKLVEKYDSATVLGFDLFGIDKHGNRKTYFNGMVAGYFSFEFYTVSARQSCIVLLGYQNGYLSKYPFCLGDTKEMYAEKFKKQKPESSFIQKKESSLVVEKIIEKEKNLGFLPNNRFVTLLVLTPIAYLFLPFSLNPSLSNNVAFAGNCGSSTSVKKQNSAELAVPPVRSEDSSTTLNNSKRLNEIQLPTAWEAAQMVYKASQQVAIENPTIEGFRSVMTGYFNRGEPTFSKCFGPYFTSDFRTGFLLDNQSLDSSRTPSNRDSDGHPRDVRINTNSESSLSNGEPFPTDLASGEVEMVGVCETAVSGAPTMGVGGQSSRRSTPTSLS